MNSSNKKSPGARAIPQPFNKQAGHAPQFKPAVTQLKNAVSAQSVKRPVAPPAYRPQATPKVLQAKSSSAQNPRAGQAPRPPMTPPVYRPEAKKIVQPKAISQPRNVPAAPPAYRPEQKGIAQPKMASAAQARTPPKAPPVYRPQPKPTIAQAGLPVQMKARPVATPVRGNAAQVKPCAPVQMPKAAAALSHTPRGSVGGRTIQRTVWRYSGGAWAMESSSSSDTDPHPTPDVYCATNGIAPGEHDKYDQQTGDYRPWAAAREKTGKRAKSKKRPGNYGKFFDSSRATTPYAYFKPREDDEVRSKPQGPHLVAHVTKRTVFDLAEEMGLNPEAILDSKLMPKPRQALKMMEDMLAARSITPEKSGALSTWYRDYKRAYAKAVAKKPGWKQGVKEAMELHPLTTYRVGEVASASELAGKKEDAEVALDDIDLLLAHPRASGLPGGLTTVDGGYAAEGWGPGDLLRQDFVYNYALASIGRPPSPSPYLEAPLSPPQDDDW